MFEVADAIFRECRVTGKSTREPARRDAARDARRGRPGRPRGGSRRPRWRGAPRRGTGRVERPDGGHRRAGRPVARPTRTSVSRRRSRGAVRRVRHRGAERRRGRAAAGRDGQQPRAPRLAGAHGLPDRGGRARRLARARGAPARARQAPRHRSAPAGEASSPDPPHRPALGQQPPLGGERLDAREPRRHRHPDRRHRAQPRQLEAVPLPPDRSRARGADPYAGRRQRGHGALLPGRRRHPPRARARDQQRHRHPTLRGR